MKTGEFAKAAGVSEKTIRYYDKIGLLKPSVVHSNGYREYSDLDLIRLQEIILYKQLDFSLDEISRLILHSKDAARTYRFQKELVVKKIRSLRDLEYALDRVAQTVEHHHCLASKDVTELIRLTNLAKQTADNYKDSSYLKDRIILHMKYSMNPVPWFKWLIEQMIFTGKRRILEVGCGNGELWKYCNPQILRNREVFLTDKSEGMIEEVREKLGNDFNCIVADGMQIPFKNSYFDLIIANHVLFYYENINLGIKEISRVLNEDGIFYCTTYGSRHMKEITEICREFDARIQLSTMCLSEVFGAENGEDILKTFFHGVEKLEYPDELVVDQADDLINYILSCHGNQSELLIPVIGQFREFLEERITEKGPIHITKQAVLFCCTHPVKDS
ncbi:MerR family transcriptional regulator [Faecalibaculum rodentium]|uniref:MerR family transcriptional regulator n=2 Tax=Faecalibaculum rodentium TaxID=1702221 RepID=UPI0023F15D37|nr:MerR family transcriptional regulator [Faecalibaculum rodentium]